MRVGLKALAVVAVVASGLAGCLPSTNEDRAQEYLDREYGDAKYNVLGCGADGLFDDQGTIVECSVHEAGGDMDDDWTITVEFDGDGGEVVRVQGMPE